jgi:iron(III) transport system permease protein
LKFLRIGTFLVVLLLAIPPCYLLLRTSQLPPARIVELLNSYIAQTAIRTVALVIAVAAGTGIIGVSLAFLTAQSDLPWRRAWSVILSLPLVVPSYVVAMVNRSLFPREWIGFPSAFITLTLLSYPYVMLPVRAALKGIDPALLESAKLLGCDDKACFARVVIPLLLPSIAGGVLLAALYTLSDFGAVSLLGYETFTWAIYLQYQSSLDRTAAALYALLLAIAAGLLLIAGMLSRRPGSIANRSGRRIPTLRLGVWKAPALILCVCIAAAALLLPAFGLGNWAIRGISSGETVSLSMARAGSSVAISLVAATVAVLLALAPAALSARAPGKLSKLSETITAFSFALPGIVVALSLVFFTTRLVPYVYQTYFVLVAAYAILYLEPALGTTRSAFLQVNPRLEEAGAILGGSALDVLRRVTYPLVRPGVAAAFMLVFLLVMKELPATLILAPMGFRTLATEIWSASSEAFFARAAVPALLLVLCSSVPMALIVSRADD